MKKHNLRGTRYLAGKVLYLCLIFISFVFMVFIRRRSTGYFCTFDNNDDNTEACGTRSSAGGSSVTRHRLPHSKLTLEHHTKKNIYILQLYCTLKAHTWLDLVQAMHYAQYQYICCSICAGWYIVHGTLYQWYNCTLLTLERQDQSCKFNEKQQCWDRDLSLWR